ncbi:hypothetical protein [Mycolicibacterium psychrotolerans]|uniref:Uncharacterized protein n=1 Tax=Mycolicibacterium psychrotolerans TaxID=216929 RepID=A0A7I7MD22_9MYCO|nr:hypothetical protein [Mycolicibacterium psychrotolerans]BBX70168.1 hypothetical protein MPSYJ_36290 [Mycolicibacterium psychrotolerans]
MTTAHNIAGDSAVRVMQRLPEEHRTVGADIKRCVTLAKLQQPWGYTTMVLLALVPPLWDTCDGPVPSLGH